MAKLNDGHLLDGCDVPSRVPRRSKRNTRHAMAFKNTRPAKMAIPWYWNKTKDSMGEKNSIEIIKLSMPTIGLVDVSIIDDQNY